MNERQDFLVVQETLNKNVLAPGDHRARLF
jgi:hypothetical protein